MIKLQSVTYSLYIKTLPGDWNREPSIISTIAIDTNFFYTSKLLRALLQINTNHFMWVYDLSMFRWKLKLSSAL